MPEWVVAKLVVDPLNRSRPADIAILEHAASTFDSRAAAAMAARFASDGTWQVPTLIRIRAMHRCRQHARAALDLAIPRRFSLAAVKHQQAAVRLYDQGDGGFELARAQLELGEALRRSSSRTELARLVLTQDSG